MLKRTVATIGLLALLGAISAPVLAAPTKQASPPPSPLAGEGLEISPPVIQLQSDPGKTLTVNIRIRNVTKQNLLAVPKADDFGAKGETGEPQILLDEKEATRFSLKYWIAPIATQLLVPQEIKTTTVKINVPANAEPGGHFGVVRFTAVPPELAGQGVALSASIGTLILLKVNGPITEKLNVKEMYVSHGGGKGSFFESGPFTFTERIENTGSVHLQPTGTITISNPLGKKVATLDVNKKPQANVLPDSVRRFDQQWNKIWLFGYYTAKLHMTYGTNKGTLDKTIGFWIIPYKLIAIILVLLVALFFLLRYLLRRYNRYIIKQARRR